MDYTHYFCSVFPRQDRIGRRRDRRHAPKARLKVELLEDRLVPSTVFRSIDGTGNNPFHIHWGAARTDLIRIAPSAYADGKSAPAGASRPSARYLSNALSDQTDPADPSQDLDLKNNK